ncbi:HEPN/Toprim-associated domain-containing protein [Pseudoduganella violaceinigra]|uniref:HEPN/Toprim-associated domain-containing protein n=1 Tax=Pseudoduganella violaceinigra TaxID=246602 RepID=UPI0004018980|nr:HEPN/Toprim-associated domain-containing protein [Pseudoduganella violaceinigra]
MSTPLTLSVGDIILTYNTMHMGIDHGMLFQERDWLRLENGRVIYDRCEQSDGEEVSLKDMCFCRSLSSLIPRLELLGYTIKAVKADYERAVAYDQEQYAETMGTASIGNPERLTFDQLTAFVHKYPVHTLNDNYVPDYDAEHEAKRGLFASEPDINLLPGGDPDRDTGGYSERSHFGNLLGFLDPYSVLRILGENPENLNLQVVWNCGEFIDAGWAREHDFVSGARRTQTYLIATEGSSDTHILKRAIALLRPDIQDFFRFIDVEDRHPFSGTGSLAKFAEGLVKIDVQNRVVFLFDNDAEGRDAFHGLQRFTFPTNMRATVLPDIEELRNFPARGPDGITYVDINRRAAAIECYLDLRLKDRKPPQVTWTNYKEKLGVYQGALDFKESYANAFFNATEESIRSNEYDVSKLRIVLDLLERQCSLMAEQMLPFWKYGE